MRKFVYVLSLIVIYYGSNAQPIATWMTQKKVSLNNYGYCVSVGPEGNVYVSGAFTGSYRNPGPNEMGCFLTCYNVSGKEQWHKEFYNPHGAIAAFNKVDSKGNVILAGPGLLRFDNAGSLIDTFPATGLRRCEGLTVDQEDNVIIAGHCYGDSLIGKIRVVGNSFLAKYSSTGTQVWALPCFITFGTNQDFDFAVDTMGNIYTTGGFGGTIPISKNFSLTSEGHYDGFLLKYNPQGEVQWAKRFGGSGISWEYPRALTVSKEGSLYIAGTYNGVLVAETFSSNLQKGVCDLFVVKYDTDGNLQWLKSGGGEDLEKVREITIDQSDNLFFTGYYLSPGTFHWGDYSFIQTEKDRGYFYVMQLDQDGEVINLTRSDVGTGEGRDLTCDNLGHLYVTGGFGGILDFAGQTLEGEGMFLMKLSYDMNNKVGLHEESPVEDLFQIFPNPGKDVFYIGLGEDICPEASIQVYETSGRCILSKQNIACDERNFQCTAPPGVYMVELRSGSKRQTRKVIVK